MNFSLLEVLILNYINLLELNLKILKILNFIEINTEHFLRSIFNIKFKILVKLNYANKRSS